MYCGTLAILNINTNRQLSGYDDYDEDDNEDDDDGHLELLATLAAVLIHKNNVFLKPYYFPVSRVRRKLFRL